MDFLFQAFTGVSRGAAAAVSILVVMDFLFQDRGSIVGGAAQPCFNPCCDGFPISSLGW